MMLDVRLRKLEVQVTAKTDETAGERLCEWIEQRAARLPDPFTDDLIPRSAPLDVGVAAFCYRQGASPAMKASIAKWAFVDGPMGSFCRAIEQHILISEG